jgi:hypothetical protein
MHEPIPLHHIEQNIQATLDMNDGLVKQRIAHQRISCYLNVFSYTYKQVEAQGCVRLGVPIDLSVRLNPPCTL